MAFFLGFSAFQCRILGLFFAVFGAKLGPKTSLASSNLAKFEGERLVKWPVFRPFFASFF